MPFCIWHSRRGKTHYFKMQSGVEGAVVIKTFAVEDLETCISDTEHEAGMRFQRELVAAGNPHGLYPVILSWIERSKIARGYVNRGRTYVGGGGTYLGCTAYMDGGVHAHLEYETWPFNEVVGFRNIPTTEARLLFMAKVEAANKVRWLRLAAQAQVHLGVPLPSVWASQTPSPFHWSSPDAVCPEVTPVPWRVANQHNAEIWIKTITDAPDVYVDFRNREYERETLWIGLRDNRDTVQLICRLTDIRDRIEKLGLPVTGAFRDGNLIGLVIRDDLPNPSGKV